VRAKGDRETSWHRAQLLRRPDRTWCWTASAQFQHGQIERTFEGARLSGVRGRVVSEGWRREGPPLCTTYLVVSLDDEDVDELTSGDSSVGWELVVCGIDVGRVADCRCSRGASVGFRGSTRSPRSGPPTPARLGRRCARRLQQDVRMGRGSSSGDLDNTYRN
jgi:hypothetical protein